MEKTNELLSFYRTILRISIRSCSRYKDVAAMTQKSDNAEQKIHNEEQHEHNVEQFDDNVILQQAVIDAQEVVNVAQQVFNHEMRRYVRRALIGYLIFAGAIIVALWISWGVRGDNITQVNGINLRQCNSIANLYDVIRATIDKNDARIDTLQYYKMHPLEAEVAHADNAVLKTKFASPACPSDITINK